MEPKIANFQLQTSEDFTEPNGFVDSTQATISFTDGTRQFSISPVGADYVIYHQGSKRVISTTLNVTITADEGIHYIYIDADGVLQSTLVPGTWIIYEEVIVAIIYWSAVDSTGILVANEMHGSGMSAVTHHYLHTTVGTAYVSGLGLANLVVDGSGDSATHAQFGVEDGEIRDEDIRHFAVDGSPQDIHPIGYIPVLWRSGASGVWRLKTADAYPVIYSGTAGYTGGAGRLAYNQWTGTTWQLTECANASYVLVHVVATNDINHPIMAIQGQHNYADIASAQNGAASELIGFSDFPFIEFSPIATVIFETSNGMTNTPKGAIASASTGDYMDWRKAAGFAQSASGTTAQPGCINFFTTSQPTSNEAILKYVACMDKVISANFSGSQATSETATTAATVYTITRNGSTIGTITYGAGTNVGVFADNTEIGTHAVAAGDIIRIIAPASPDATHDNLIIAIHYFLA